MDRKNLTKDNHSTCDPCNMAVQLKQKPEDIQCITS